MRGVLLAGALSACAAPVSRVPAECNPLGGESCLLPWPSMAYAKRDAEFSPTGFRLALPSEAMPSNVAGAWIHPSPFNRWDGFSTIGPLLAQFETEVSPTELPADPAASLADDAAIVLIDVTAGERAPFVATVDGTTVIVRPVRRLHPGHRYAVAIRDRVRAADGQPLPIAEGFAAMRDGADYAHPRFAAVRERARDMFAALEATGVARDELVLAWDFVTASDDFVRSDLVTMRNASLPVLGVDGEYLTHTLADGEGVVRTPNFLTPSGTGLHRDEWEWDARPMLDGLRDARFAVYVPPCATSPRPVLLVGHALFGSPVTALEDPFVRQLATDHCAIAIATEHVGLAAEQRSLAPTAMADVNHLAIVTGNLAQSMIDLHALAALVRGPLARALPIDPANITYVGRSLGGVVGATYLAYESAPIRAAIAPGAWLSPELLATMRSAYPRDAHVVEALVTMSFEPYDPRVTATDIAHDTLAWAAMADADAESLAREMSLPVLAPSVMSPWGMHLATEAPRGFVVFDNATAETRALARQIAQLIDGEPLTQQCALAGAPAPCDCATGACD